MTTMYAVEHEQSGHALFTQLEDAKKWADEQSDYHHEGQAVRWVDGGHHGWHAQDLADGTTAATVRELLVDDKLPDWRPESPHYWE